MRLFAAAVSYALILGVLAACVLFGQPEISSEVAQRPAAFRAERAMEDLREIDSLTTATGGRAAGSRGNAVVATYIGRRMGEAGLNVYEQAFEDRMGGSMRNIIGVLPGTRDGAIVLSAHHDAPGRSSAAVEGTAGIAVMLELARAAAESEAAAREKGLEPSRTLVFASWDGEVFGCAGATHFVESLPAIELQGILAMVSVDAVGWRDGREVIHALPYEDRFGTMSIAPDWLVTRASNAARARGESLPVGDLWLGPVYQVLARRVDLGYYSDDRAFLAKGVPAVFVSNFSITRSYPFGGTGKDTVDQVGLERIASVGRSVEGVLADLATAERLPVGEQQYLVLDFPLTPAFRLTPDQIKVLALLSLLPGACVLLVRERASGLTAAGVLFSAFAGLFVSGTLIDPILFTALFLPALLASPLLAVRRPGAVLGHLSAQVPVLLFAALLVPIYVTRSSQLVKIGGGEFLLIGSIAAIGLVQTPLHQLRVRRAIRARKQSGASRARVAPVTEAPPAAPPQAVPRGAPGAS